VGSVSSFSQAVVTGALIGSLYGAVAMGFSLIFGVVRIANFAHAGVVVWAMYGVFWAVHLAVAGPYVAIALAVPLFFALGLLLQRTLFSRISETTEEMQIIFTFGFLLVLMYLMQFFFGSDVRYLPFAAKPFTAGGVIIQREVLYGGLVSALALVALQLFLGRTWLGKAIRASADNRRGAVLAGLDVRRLTRTAMALSTALAALAGGLLATFTTVYPLRAFELAVLAFLIVVLGGIRNVAGAFGAGVIVGLLDSLGTLTLGPSLAQLMIHGLIFGCLLVRPQGLWGQKELA
jgi:branched-chain amino acid transport system permease protein